MTRAMDESAMSPPPRSLHIPDSQTSRRGRTLEYKPVFALVDRVQSAWRCILTYDTHPDLPQQNAQHSQEENRFASPTVRRHAVGDGQENSLANVSHGT